MNGIWINWIDLLSMKNRQVAIVLRRDRYDFETDLVHETRTTAMVNASNILDTLNKNITLNLVTGFTQPDNTKTRINGLGKTECD